MENQLEFEFVVDMRLTDILSSFKYNEITLDIAKEQIINLFKGRE